MKRGVDTNVLIYAHIPSFEHHSKVHRFLSAQLKASDVTLVLTPGVLHEWVHIVTDPRRFQPPIPMAEALAVARSYLNRSNIGLLSPDEGSVLLAFEMLEQHSLGRKRIADTLMAATLLRHGVREILTCNPKDFAPFEGLTAVDPRFG